MLFKKLAWMTDIHWGRSSNNSDALRDNEEFTKWFIDEAKARGCDLFIFGGDFFDSRNNIHLVTLKMAMESLERINAAFPKSYFILGNHDLFHREKRDTSSVIVAKNFKNIEIIDKPITTNDVSFLPWMIGDENKMRAPKSRYSFSHLELPGFLMNARIELPETPHSAKASSFVDQEFVFTGHFHIRQIKKNIIYTGSVFPFNFSDNFSEDRGAMFLDWGGQPEFVAWPDQPLFRTMKLSQLLESPQTLLCPKLTARVSLDVDISYEEAQIIKETFIDTYGLRRVELIPQTKSESDGAIDDTVFQSVDQIVIDGLMSIDGAEMSPAKLVEIYKGLA
jgi:hypothetical protein